MTSPQRIVVLISGRGSNLSALLTAQIRRDWGRASIVGVVSNRPDAGGLDLAQRAGVPVFVVDHRAAESREVFDEQLLSTVEALRPDLVVLAGFMRVLADSFVRRFEGRLLNIHPSLLPSFAGLNTHRRALATGVKLHGATVHYVIPALDQGPIIVQAAVPVLPDDTEASLASRVLEAEHHILPLAVGWHLEGALTLEGSQVRHREAAPQWLWLDAHHPAEADEGTL